MTKFQDSYIALMTTLMKIFLEKKNVIEEVKKEKGARCHWGDEVENLGR